MKAAVCRDDVPGSRTASCPKHNAPRLPSCRVTRRVLASSSSNQQPEPLSSASSSAASQQPVTREFRAFGSKVVETNVPFKGPEDQEDFWEGEKFDVFGKVLENYFIPGLLALALVCGGIAAKTYNDGATEYIKPPTGPLAEPTIIMATPQ